VFCVGQSLYHVVLQLEQERGGWRLVSVGWVPVLVGAP
jgi:hypothetical protein